MRRRGKRRTGKNNGFVEDREEKEAGSGGGKGSGSGSGIV